MLGQVWLFSGLDRNEIQQIALLAKLRRWQARQVVVSQGDTGGDLYAVVSGRLKVTSANADGDEKIFSILGPNEAFGEIALLDGEPRSATVTTLEPCELLVIERGAFMELVGRVPLLARSLMVLMARRLRDLTAHTQDVSLLDVEGRLAKVILALAGRFGTHGKGGRLSLAPHLSQQELANMVGASRELVNRRLGGWAEEGIISLTARELIIEDLAALARVAGEDVDPPSAHD